MSREHHGAPPAEAIGTAETGVVTLESNALLRRQKAMIAYIEQRVLAGFNAEEMLNSTELADVQEYIKGLSPKEKVEALYGEIVVYDEVVGTMMNEELPEYSEEENQIIELEGSKRKQFNPIRKIKTRERKEKIASLRADIDPLLLARLSLLWADTPTREAFLSRYTESREADKQVRVSAVGKEYRSLSSDREKLSARFEHIEKSLFTGAISRPDKVRSAQRTAERLIKSKHTIETKLSHIAALKDRPATPENFNLAAHIMFDTIARYSNEAKSAHGFIWLPYFEEMLRRGVECARSMWLN